MNTRLSGGRPVKVLAVLSLLLLVSACAGSSSHMKNVAADKANYAVQPDKALVVFMRPSGLGFAIQSSVFDVTSGEPEFVGIISAKTKLAHYVPPGERKFMVISESADFLGATLSAGKAYFALVTPRMGMWRARFSLRGVTGSEAGGKQFSSWYRASRWVENTDSSQAWASANMASVKQKLVTKLPQWEGKIPKPMLAASDGQSSLPQ